MHGKLFTSSGKLLMILLLYIKEDAATVRQPIYGLLIGNFLIVGLVVLLRNHEVVPAVPGREPNIAFVDEMGWLMVWGTTLLFLDAIGVILLYEHLGRWLRNHQFARIFLASAAMLTFDQFGFFLALHYIKKLKSNPADQQYVQLHIAHSSRKLDPRPAAQSRPHLVDRDRR